MDAAGEFAAFVYIVAAIGILSGVILGGQFWHWFKQ